MAAFPPFYLWGPGQHLDTEKIQFLGCHGHVHFFKTFQCYWSEVVLELAPKYVKQNGIFWKKTSRCSTCRIEGWQMSFLVQRLELVPPMDFLRVSVCGRSWHIDVSVSPLQLLLIMNKIEEGSKSRHWKTRIHVCPFFYWDSMRSYAL